jgi:hypothetical protein
VQDVDYFFEIVQLAGYRTESTNSIKPQSGTFVENEATLTKYIPAVAPGTYTLSHTIRKYNSAGNAKYIGAQVIIQAVPL